MEVPFDFTGTLEEGVAVLDQPALNRLNPRKCWALQWAIDHMGALSTQAQGLKRQLTTYEKVLDSDEPQKVFLLWEKHPDKEKTSLIIGLLKIGRKKLFLLDGKQQQYEVEAVCILDFYVHESKQRQGFGHIVYDAMLVEEVVLPHQTATDRPSEPFLCFLKKFYDLDDPLWQSTNFVVFPQFFEDHEPASREGRRRNNNSHGISEKTSTVGSRSNSVTASPRHYNIGKDNASGIIHGTAPLPARPNYAPDTPQGRKNTRDFGHTSLW